MWWGVGRITPASESSLRWETFERTAPATAAGMLKYLSSGAVKGIGKATAVKNRGKPLGRMR